MFSFFLICLNKNVIILHNGVNIVCDNRCKIYKKNNGKPRMKIFKNYNFNLF